MAPYNEKNGFCYCGCGEKTNRTQRTDSNLGYHRGDHFRYIAGHNGRGSLSGRWNGGIRKQGKYFECFVGVRERAYQHRMIAERAFGKELPPGSVVHHHKYYENGSRSLVICQNSAYHNLLHARERAIAACGNPSWRKCNICKNWDEPKNLIIRTTGNFHLKCKNKAQLRRRLKLNQKKGG